MCVKYMDHEREIQVKNRQGRQARFPIGCFGESVSTPSAPHLQYATSDGIMGATFLLLPFPYITIFFWYVYTFTF